MEASEEKKNTAGQSQRSKKPRKRMKATFAMIKDQMEFYFGDVNLNKDRFMKKIINENPEGYVDLDIFLKFNKIAALTDDVNVIVDSLMYKSTMLEVNEERTKVRRTTPVSVPKNIDERTVYVECLPHNINHEWVKRLFSGCGKVAYVSLPRYPSSRDLKGFAFVEFETIEGAEAACKELNNPPVTDITEERVGMFPKSSHQLDALKKKLPEDQVKETEEKVKEILVQGKEAEESEVTKEDNDADKNLSNNLTVPTKRQRSISENSTECPTPTKRKKTENMTETSQASDTDKSSTLGSKKKSRKRKSRSKTCEAAPQESDATKSDCEMSHSVESTPKKKKKQDEPVSVEESGTNKEDQLKQNDKENNVKKKKRLRKKKEKKEKDIPELRVIPKKEWLKLRKEYLELQKTNMKLLKQTLNEKMTEENKAKEDKKKKKEIQFVANVIVKVVSEEPITRKILKEQFKEDVQIAYLDIHDGLCEGYIRCLDADSATNLMKTSLDKVTFNRLTGEDEKQYWDKLTSDRETKLTTKCRAKKRGHQKLMDKAQKVSSDTIERKHIVFDDE